MEVSKIEFETVVAAKERQIKDLTDRVEELSGKAKQEQLRAWAIDRAIEVVKVKGQGDLSKTADEIISYVKGE